MNAKPLYMEIASLIQARETCIERGNKDWQNKHTEMLEYIARDVMPSGSGIDSGTKIDLPECKPERLVFTVAYHHMNEGGYYDGWTEHSLIVTPSLQFGFNLRITGRDRNQIKDYLHDVYHTALSAPWINPLYRCNELQQELTRLTTAVTAANLAREAAPNPETLVEYHAAMAAEGDWNKAHGEELAALCRRWS